MKTIPTVFIPAAGVGSRLRPLTDHLPKALVGVAGKPAITHVIDLYSKDTRFVVAIGHRGDILREYLRTAHPRRNIVFAEISDFCGPRSGLGLTISESVHLLNSPFAFHAVDALVTEAWWNRLQTGSDALVVAANPPFAGLYRRARLTSDGSACAELSEPCPDPGPGWHTYVGICFVADAGRFAAWARSASGETGESDYLRRAIPRGVSAIRLEQWHDVGSPAALRAARETLSGNSAITSSQKLLDATFSVGTRIIKVHGSPGLAKQKQDRAAALGSTMPGPVTAGDYCLTYRKVAGVSLAARPDRPDQLRRLLPWLRRHLWTGEWCRDHADPDFRLACELFYQKGTADRIAQLPAPLRHAKVAAIDGVPVTVSLAEIFRGLPWSSMADGIAVRWHGDLHSENILVTRNNGFVLLDWRDGFGCMDPAQGDLYYDLAKLRHGFVLPDAIFENGNFTVTKAETGAGISVASSYRQSEADLRCLEILEDQVGAWGLDWGKVRLICGLVFLRMSPLYLEREIIDLLWAVGMREIAAARRLLR